MSDIECPNEERIPYSQRVEWKDVVPISVEDGPDSICPISYLEEFKDTMSYLRAVMKTNEISERAFDLVGDSINMHPANYSAWLYRMELFLGLNKDAIDELDWISNIAAENPKNYQLWHQRQRIIQELYKRNEIENFGSLKIDSIADLFTKASGSKNVEIPQSAGKLFGEQSFDIGQFFSKNEFKNKIIESEVNFLNEQIDLDSKNFHAWSYRQFVVKTFGLYEYEFLYAKLKIEQDIRNNSAWNQLYFVLNSHFLKEEVPTPDQGLTGIDQAKVSKESILKDLITFSVEKIHMTPSNESPWVFVQGLLRIHGPELLYTDLYTQINQLSLLKDKKSTYLAQSRFYWEFMAKYYIQKRDFIGSDGVEYSEWNSKAKSAYDKLSNLDPVRKNYWNYLVEKNIVSTLS
ncbi:Protein farnesyltransferase/geranylgeranyltransferase type-1 subunit alpha [Smittium mucronatum]|uniref:Protein farnesyltransferase/geranylgeranyltransferase type-1 subunit alpha n=1 Tax=Smittium mucronatum TaxID=133383 RepID=A0A1R0H2J9_9FUNG|nr:Protein farnesyltransferase/geranylgeranyltransferase type-1 subunit alpha [Smittium mucronatum]